MSYSVTRDFAAPAEVVFNTATDLDRWARWLPAGVRVQPAGPDELRVAWAATAHTIRWQVMPDQLRATADPVGQPWSATLRVVPGSGGSSSVQLEIDGDAGGLRPAAERALAHLSEEVSDNFNVS